MNNSPLGKKKIAGIVVGCIILIMGIVVLGLTIWIKKNKLTQPGKYMTDKLGLFMISIINADSTIRLNKAKKKKKNPYSLLFVCK